jgi:protein O-mannosyl-transferase
MNRRRVVLTVALSAVVVYLGALWNGFALDDVSIIATNPWVHRWAELWQAFGQPYWPPWLGAAMYRPLPIASYAIDWQTQSVMWMHAANLLWHAGASVAVAALLLRLTDSDRGALLGGVIFAVHPLHVEAVANIVGRAELMAALFTVLAVYAALAHDRLWWSLGALVLGLLSKETAATVPALVVWGWMLGIGRPERRRMFAYAIGWGVVAAAYLAVRWTILHPYARMEHLAAVFIGAGPLSVRLTTIAAFTDVARLLMFPLVLRVDYSPAERTLVTSLVDGRFLAGVLCLLLWAGFLVLAWRRGRRVEAFGLGWIAIAFLPVANLFFPTGVLVAERTLYLPSVGLALAVGAWLCRIPSRWYWSILGCVALLGAVRTAGRVPVWKNSRTVALSVLEDSPNSFSGPARMIGIYLAEHQPAKALDAFRQSTAIFDRVPPVFLQGADAAFAVGQPRLADSLLARMEQLCYRCLYYYQYEAGTARARGDTAVAESILVRLRRLDGASGKIDR